MAREREQVDEQFNEPVIADEATPDERPTQVNRSMAASSQMDPTTNGTGGQPAIVPVVGRMNAAVSAPAANATDDYDAPTYADLPDVIAATAAPNDAPGNVMPPSPQPLQSPYMPPVNAGPAPHHRPEAPNPQATPQAQREQQEQADPRYTHVPWAAATSWGTSSLNGANTAAGLSYLFWWVSGLIVYFNERHNRYVRFHAVQSILLTGTLNILAIVLYILYELLGDAAAAVKQPWIGHIGLGILLLGFLGIAIVWVGAMVAAWNGHYLRIPILGEYAERYAAPPREPYPGSPPF